MLQRRSHAMVTSSQEPAAICLTSVETWRKVGCFVKEGEKGILIRAPVIRRETESPATHADSVNFHPCILGKAETPSLTVPRRSNTLVVSLESAIRIRCAKDRT